MPFFTRSSTIASEDLEVEMDEGWRRKTIYL
jgi:hypothetical protein